MRKSPNSKDGRDESFGLSRTERGIFGFTERGWNPSPEAGLSVVAEIATAIVCTVALVLASRRSASQQVAQPS